MLRKRRCIVQIERSFDFVRHFSFSKTLKRSETPEKIQLKYILNISQQNIYHTCNVRRWGDTFIYCQVSTTWFLVNCLETQLNVDIFENESKYFCMYILSSRDWKWDRKLNLPKWRPITLLPYFVKNKLLFLVVGYEEYI
jgi:hypothetical protein